MPTLMVTPTMVICQELTRQPPNLHYRRQYGGRQLKQGNDTCRDLLASMSATLMHRYAASVVTW